MSLVDGWMNGWFGSYEGDVICGTVVITRPACVERTSARASEDEEENRRRGEDDKRRRGEKEKRRRGKEENRKIGK